MHKFLLLLFIISCSQLNYTYKEKILFFNLCKKSKIFINEKYKINKKEKNNIIYLINPNYLWYSLEKNKILCKGKKIKFFIISDIHQNTINKIFSKKSQARQNKIFEILKKNQKLYNCISAEGISKDNMYIYQKNKPNNIDYKEKIALLPPKIIIGQENLELHKFCLYLYNDKLIFNTIQKFIIEDLRSIIAILNTIDNMLLYEKINKKFKNSILFKPNNIRNCAFIIGEGHIKTVIKILNYLNIEYEIWIK